MKKLKTLLLISLFAVSMRAYADTSLVLPAEFLTNVANNAQFKADLNMLERLLVGQTMKNSGAGLKDYKVESIMNYFNRDKSFRQIGPNMLLEPRTGATLIFQSDNRCDNNACAILADLNGDKGPNQMWHEYANPKDRIIFTLKKTGDGGLEVNFPELH